MAVAPVSAEPDNVPGERAEAGAGASRSLPTVSWLQPVAAAVLAVSAAGSLWILSRYVQAHESITAEPDSPPVAAAIVLAVIAVMALSILVFRPQRGALRSLIATSGAWSIALLAGLTVAWAAVASSEHQNRWYGVPVVDMAETEAMLARLVPADRDPIRIPTGIIIESMEFLTGDNVQVTGYFWQRFGPDVPDDLDRGVVFAQGVKDGYYADEAYRFEENGVETIGWHFAATLREPFEFAEYPFDEQNLALRIWPLELSEDIVLVPDFDAYRSMDPTLMPGVESEFVYSGWSPVYSGFSIADQRYDTSFGIGDAGEFAEMPDLYFNFILDRDFVGPFFEYVVFALAVAFLLFALLALTTNDETLKTRFQLTTASLLISTSGLLFAVILKHNQLRTVVASQVLSYFEVIPILLYGAVVYVVMNAILVASPLEVKLIQHRNNLIPTLIYWPLLLGVLLVVTLAVFFRA